MDKKKKLWIVDAVSFLGFLIALKLEWTGLAIHEWLGLAVGGVLLVHILMHWQWVVCVTKNFNRVKGGVRFNYLVDVGLGIGFVLILGTGLVISNLLSLMISVDFYRAIFFVHVLSSFTTLVLLFVKTAKHMDWITNTTKHVFGIKAREAKSPVLAISADEAEKTCIKQGETIGYDKNRREALRMTVIGGLGFLIAGKSMGDWLVRNYGTSEIAEVEINNEVAENGSIHNEDKQEDETHGTGQGNGKRNGDGRGKNRTATAEALDEIDEEVATPEPAMMATATPVIVVEPTMDVLAGVLPCRKGKKCSYPGDCRDYQDINSNGLCDRGEV